MPVECAYAGRSAVSLGDSKNLKVGQRVYAVGAPEGLELTLSEGLISALRSVANFRYIQTTASISHGSSGGGLFDAQGRLIGITTFYWSDGQNLNFALPADWIQGLPERARAETQANVNAPNQESDWVLPSPSLAQPPVQPVPPAATPVEAEAQRLESESKAIEQQKAALDARGSALDQRKSELDDWKARLEAGQATARALGIPRAGPSQEEPAASSLFSAPGLATPSYFKSPQEAQFEEALGPFNKAVDEHNASVAQLKADSAQFAARLARFQADARKLDAWQEGIAGLAVGTMPQAPPATPALEAAAAVLKGAPPPTGPRMPGGMPGTPTGAAFAE